MENFHPTWSRQSFAISTDGKTPATEHIGPLLRTSLYTRTLRRTCFNMLWSRKLWQSYMSPRVEGDMPMVMMSTTLMPMMTRTKAAIMVWTPNLIVPMPRQHYLINHPPPTVQIQIFCSPIKWWWCCWWWWWWQSLQWWWWWRRSLQWWWCFLTPLWHWDRHTLSRPSSPIQPQTKGF